MMQGIPGKKAMIIRLMSDDTLITSIFFTAVSYRDSNLISANHSFSTTNLNYPYFGTLAMYCQTRYSTR